MKLRLLIVTLFITSVLQAQTPFSLSDPDG